MENNERENLIKEYEAEILSSASFCCKKYITKSDDEFSIALIAFNKCLDTYDKSKGQIMTYANTFIKNALIDYYRSQNNPLEVLTAPNVLADNCSPEEDENNVTDAVYYASIAEETNSAKDEILAANSKLSHYGFSFFELSSCSPKLPRPKRECASAIRYMLRNPLQIKAMRITKKLPSAAILTNTGISPKILDRYRKYIICAIVILYGDYPTLSEYLKYVWKEN